MAPRIAIVVLGLLVFATIFTQLAITHYSDCSTNSTRDARTQEAALPAIIDDVVTSEADGVPESTHEAVWEKEASAVDWSQIEYFIAKHPGAKLPTHLMRPLLHALSATFVVPPNAPIRYPTRPPAFSLPGIQCDSHPLLHPKHLTGRMRPKPVKVVDLTLFAYEVDVLEIRLAELWDVVDMFVIIECTCTHRFTPRDLILGAQLNSRYSPFREKITYFVLDDAECAKYSGGDTDAQGDDWRLEPRIREILWNRFRQSVIFKDFSDDDTLVMMSDCDEIPRADIVNHLKQCEVTDAGLPMLFSPLWYTNSFNFVHQGSGDFPEITTGAMAESLLARDTKRGAKLPPSSGGFHLNRFGSNYLRLYKHLSLAEGGQPPRGDIDYLRHPERMQELIDRGERECCAKPKLPPLEQRFADVDDRLAFIRSNVPWFAICNYQRYWHFLSESMVHPHSWSSITSEWCQ